MRMELIVARRGLMWDWRVVCWASGAELARSVVGERSSRFAWREAETFARRNGAPYVSARAVGDLACWAARDRATLEAMLAAHAAEEGGML